MLKIHSHSLPLYTSPFILSHTTTSSVPNTEVKGPEKEEEKNHTHGIKMMVCVRCSFPLPEKAGVRNNVPPPHQPTRSHHLPAFVVFNMFL